MASGECLEEKGAEGSGKVLAFKAAGFGRRRAQAFRTLGCALGVAGLR